MILDRPSETDSSPRLDINATSLPLAWKEAHPRLLNSEITCRCSETFDCFAVERSRRDLPESEYTVVLELEDFPGYRIPTADERNGYDDRCIEHGLLIAWQAKVRAPDKKTYTPRRMSILCRTDKETDLVTFSFLSGPNHIRPMAGHRRQRRSHHVQLRILS